MGFFEIITVIAVVFLVVFFVIKENRKARKNANSGVCTSCSGCPVQEKCVSDKK